MSGFPNRLPGLFNGSSTASGSSATVDEESEDDMASHVAHDCAGPDGAGWCTPKKYSPSRLRQYRAVGHIDPALYLDEETEDLYDAAAEGHVGRLWFTLHYKKDIEQLTVTVIKARNLRVIKETNSGQPGDCFAKIFLESNERIVHTTTCKKKSNNPNFGETFCFQIPIGDVQEQCLHVPVYHVDRQKRQKLVGTARYCLRDLSGYDKDVRTFRDLETDSERSETPEARIALTLHETQQEKRITVGVFEIRNLPMRHDGHQQEVYMKVSLLQGMQGKEIKSKRTEILPVNSQSFNESFIFKVTELGQTIVRLTLMQHNSAIGTLLDKAIGSLVLGSEMFAKRGELEHWKEMCENPEEHISHWHYMQPLG